MSEKVFYRAIIFFSAEEVAGLLKESGFSEQVWVQTLSPPPEQEPRAGACAARKRTGCISGSACDQVLEVDL
ncbi:MAG: hypothetical protein JRC99_03105 [Deltaproteobacteria bacterium]|nr:hypothetical protein [Deltaproteobacteria bacterium]